MKKPKKADETAKLPPDKEQMRDEYDFSRARPNPYAERLGSGEVCAAVVLDADVAEVFPDSESVNRALRGLIGILRDRLRQPPAAASR
jgi:hypothetical protein